MRAAAILGFVLLLLAAASPAKAQSECDAMRGRVITATGTVGDLIYKDRRDLTQFFLRDANLPCRGSILALVQGRTACRDGMKVTIQGTWDEAETGTGFSPYVILSAAEAVRCRR